MSQLFAFFFLENYYIILREMFVGLEDPSFCSYLNNVLSFKKFDVCFCNLYR